MGEGRPITLTELNLYPFRKRVNTLRSKDYRRANPLCGAHGTVRARMHFADTQCIVRYSERLGLSLQGHVPPHRPP